MLYALKLECRKPENPAELGAKRSFCPHDGANRRCPSKGYYECGPKAELADVESALDCLKVLRSINSYRSSQYENYRESYS